MNPFRTNDSSNNYKTTLFAIWALICLGIIGTFLVFYATGKYGIGISPDSVAYISTARNIVQKFFVGGGRFVQFNGQPFLSWPPLFPIVLSILGFIGIDPLTGAKLINAAAFGLIVFFSGYFFLYNRISRSLVFLATLFVLTSIPLLKVSVMAWSEPLYTLFSLTFLLTFSHALRQKSLAMFVFSSVVASLACLQRYLGISLVITGLLTILFIEKQMSICKKMRYTLLFCFFSITPLLLWVFRNYYSTGTFTGYRFPAFFSLSQNILLTFNVFTLWFLPDFFPALSRLLLFMIFVGCFILVCIRIPHSREKEVKDSQGVQKVSIVVVYLITYTTVLIISSSRFATEPINDRLLAPLFPLVILMVCTTIESISYWLNSILSRWRGITLIFTIFLFFLLIYQAYRTFQMISQWKVEGAGDDFYGRSYYGQRAWQESPMIKWLRQHSLQGQIYSNEPVPLYILTGIIAGQSPRKDFVAQFKNELIVNKDKDCFLIWFEDNLNGRKRLLMHENEVSPLAELKDEFELIEIISFSDGGIYQFINPKKKLDGSNKRCLINIH